MVKTSQARKPAADKKPVGRFGALLALVKGADAEGDEAPEDEDAEDADADAEEQEGAEDEDAEDEDAEDADADAAPAAGKPNPKHAQFLHGVAATNLRWARVLTHKNAEGRLEAATTLLANPKLDAKEITGMLASMPKDGTNSALRLLDRTPRHQLGSRNQTEGGADATDAKASRKRAADRVGARLGGKTVKAQSRNKED